MRKQVFTLTLCFLFTIITPLALADTAIPLNAAPLSSVLQNLSDKGFAAVRQIKYKDGIYKAEVINSQGKEIDIRINAQTGVPSKLPAKNNLTMLDAVKKVEAAGYSHLYKVEAENGKYEVKALDEKGNKVKLEVDAMTGKVSKDWF